MWDFNIDLLQYEKNLDSATFLDNMYANFFLPYITAPSRITSHSKTLIDNIFSNSIEDGCVSGNLLSTVSDHFAQFLLFKNFKVKKEENNYVLHNFKNFSKETFENDLKNINWDVTLKIRENNVDTSFGQFMHTFNSLLNHHAPLKRSSIKH